MKSTKKRIGILYAIKSDGTREILMPADGRGIHEEPYSRTLERYRAAKANWRDGQAKGAQDGVISIELWQADRVKVVTVRPSSPQIPQDELVRRRDAYQQKTLEAARQAKAQQKAEEEREANAYQVKREAKLRAAARQK